MKQERRKCPHTSATEVASVGSRGPIPGDTWKECFNKFPSEKHKPGAPFSCPDACGLVGVNQCSFRIQFEKTELSFYLWKRHKHRAVERCVVKARGGMLSGWFQLTSSSPPHLQLELKIHRGELNSVRIEDTYAHYQEHRSLCEDTKRWYAHHQEHRSLCEDT